MIRVLLAFVFFLSLSTARAADLPFAKIVRYSSSHPAQEVLLSCESETHCSLRESSGERVKQTTVVPVDKARQLVKAFLSQIAPESFTHQESHGPALMDWEARLGDKKASGAVPRRPSSRRHEVPAATQQALLDLELALSRLRAP